MVHLLGVYTAGPCGLLPTRQQQADFPHLHLQMRVALHTKAAGILEKGFSPRVLSSLSFYLFNYTNEKLELHIILGLVGVSKGHC